MQPKIFLSEVLREIQREPVGQHVNSFDIKVVTADLKRNTGGKVLELKKVQYSRYARQGGQLLPRHMRFADNRGRKNHWGNATRTLYKPDTQEFVTIHIYLILEFNGQKVIWG